MRLAIAGLAHPHVQYLLTEVDHVADVELVGMADPDPELLERYNQRYGVSTYHDHRKLLDATSPEVVGVAGVYGDRAGVVVDALQAGAHVLADKPLATTLDQLAEIEGAAGSRTVSVLFEKRFYPVTRAARELVAAGELGDLVQLAATGPHRLGRSDRPSWFFRRRCYGGPLGDLAVHDVDLALLFSGARSGWVTASQGNAAVPDRPEFADHASALLQAGALAATLEVNWLTPDGSPYHGDYRLRVTGTTGTLEIFFARGHVDAVTDRRGPWRAELPMGLRPAEDAVASLLGGRRPEVDTAASLAATRVALLAQESADRDGIRLPWRLP